MGGAAPSDPIWAVGLMTGTVLDGNVDVAIIRTDGVRVGEFGPFTFVPYSQRVRELAEEAMLSAREWAFDGPEPAIFAEAEAALTRAQAEAVRVAVQRAGMALSEFGVVGFHGQSVIHRPPAPGKPGATRQLGDGELMHDLLGVPVAYDFRSADMRAGGQGAPLAPIYHRARLEALGLGDDVAVLNLGGVGNVTWWGSGDELVAFDTGPANAPINDLVRAAGGGEMDRDGELALVGTVDEARLAHILAHPHFAAPYPKSLDRFAFPAQLVADLKLADGVATLTVLVAESVRKALDLLPRRPHRVIVSGGGRHNPAIMRMLRERAHVDAVVAETVG